MTAHGRRRWMPKHGGNPTDSHNETDDGHLSDELEIELVQLTMMRPDAIESE